MTRSILFTLTAVILGAAPAAAQQVLPGPNGPTVVWPSPNYPPPGPIVTPNVITGVNPQTGGLDTSNTQIDPSAFDPNRFESQFNGSKRWVRRPIHNQFGHIVGYQQGYVWNNTVTGQEHGNLQNFTPNGLGGVQQTGQVRGNRRNFSPNGLGGVHQQTHLRSQRSTNKFTPNGLGGVHQQTHLYSKRPSQKSSVRPAHRSPSSSVRWQRVRPVR